jgi:hypothetical protein
MGNGTIVAADPLREKDNVLVLFPGRLCVATLPPSNAHRMEREPTQSAIEDAIGADCWDIPLPALDFVEGRSNSGLLEIAYEGPDGEVRRESFAIDKAKVAQLLEEIPNQAGGEWIEEVRRDHAGMAGAIVYWGVALLLALITGVFYVGIEAGWITRGPAILATIVNLLGLTGLLAIGGILVLLCFLAGCKTILFPGQAVRFTRR